MDNKNKNEKIKPVNAKWVGVVGFLIAVTLLTIAIFLSVNQEKMERLSKLNETISGNQTEAASSILSKNVNEIKANEILGTADKDDKLNTLNKTLENSDNSKSTDKPDLKKTESDIKEGSKTNEVKTETNNSNNQNTIKSDINKNKANDNKKTSKSKTNESSEKEENSSQFVKPADGEILNEFSMDSLVYSNTLEEWVTHRGIDIKGEMGSNIVSIAGGTITSIKNDPRYGLSITIEHDNGLKSIYSCMLSTEDGLEEGVKVSQGQVIGKMGNSGVFETADGAHLHFELIQNGDYINPEMYIK